MVTFIFFKWCVCTQVFSYTKKKAFQTDDLCLDVSSMGGPVKLYQCHGLGGNQLWEYDQQVKWLARTQVSLTPSKRNLFPVQLVGGWGD